MSRRAERSEKASRVVLRAVGRLADLISESEDLAPESIVGMDTSLRDTLAAKTGNIAEDAIRGLRSIEYDMNSFLEHMTQDSWVLFGDLAKLRATDQTYGTAATDEYARRLKEAVSDYVSEINKGEGIKMYASIPETGSDEFFFGFRKDMSRGEIESIMLELYRRLRREFRNKKLVRIESSLTDEQIKALEGIDGVDFVNAARDTRLSGQYDRGIANLTVDISRFGGDVQKLRNTVKGTLRASGGVVEVEDGEISVLDYRDSSFPVGVVRTDRTVSIGQRNSKLSELKQKADEVVESVKNLSAEESGLVTFEEDIKVAAKEGEAAYELPWHAEEESPESLNAYLTARAVSLEKKDAYGRDIEVEDE
jgi:hypothetical protein